MPGAPALELKCLCVDRGHRGTGVAAALLHRAARADPAHAVLGPDRLIPPEQPFLRGVPRARSGQAALRAFVAGNTAILDRVATTDEVARAAIHEPEAAAVVEASERSRRQGYRELLDTIAARFPLRPGLELDEATDVLLMYASSATYLAMIRCGWSRDRFEEWLADTLGRTLLARR